MLRLLSIAPRVVARSAVSAARITVARAAPVAAARTFTRSAQRCAAKQPAAQEQDEVEEQEEERKPLPLPEAAAGVASAVAAELASFDTTDDYVEAYVRDHQLTVSSNLDNETLIITRKNQNHEIRVTMRAEALEQEDEDQKGPEEEQENQLPEHRFLIDITNPKGNIMRLECFNSVDGELEVGSLTFPSSVYPESGLSRVEMDKDENDGKPCLRVDEMEEASSTAFFSYLESLGVDDDLAVFVASQAQIVRTKAQMDRLEKFKNFVQL